MTSSSNLLHPELFERVPMTGTKTAEKLSQFVGRYASAGAAHLPDVTVAIRTLNEAYTLEPLLDDISRQRGNPEVIIVDNESTDGTVDIAREYGAEVVSIPRGEFTYARSMNEAVAAASNNFVYTTVGHALLSNMQTLVATSTQLSRPNVAGVFARTLPGPNASPLERLVATGNIMYMQQAHNSKFSKFSIVNLGLFAAQNIGLRKDVWEDLGGFDERWESGGEDTDFAIRVLQKGGEIVEDQVVAVHHTHGLNALNYAKQWVHWAKTLRGPQRLDLDALKARRPDIDFS